MGFEDATSLKRREDKLTSDEWRVLECGSSQLLDPFLDAADGEISVDPAELVMLSDGTAMQYISATGDVSPRALIAVFDAHFDAFEVRLLQSTSDHCRLEVHVPSTGLAQVFARFGGPTRVGSLQSSTTRRRRRIAQHTTGKAPDSYR